MSTANSPDFEGLGDFSLAKTEKTPKTDLNSMNQVELLNLHAQIEAKLVGIRLSDINLEKESLIQLQRAKALQEKADKDATTPVNQLAQVQNSIRNILEGLAGIQMKLHDSETMKRWKVALIRVLKKQPKEFQDEFFQMIDTEGDAVEEELAE